MAKYSKKLVAVISELLENDMSITEVCNAVGIARKTFYEWKVSKPEFAQMIDEAQQRCYDELIVLVRRTMRENIEGYTIEETTYTYVPASYDENEMILKKKVVKRKRKEPSFRELNMLIEKTQNKQEKATTQPTATEKRQGLVAPRNREEALILADFFARVENDSREWRKSTQSENDKKLYTSVTF